MPSEPLSASPHSPGELGQRGRPPSGSGVKQSETQAWTFRITWELVENPWSSGPAAPPDTALVGLRQGLENLYFSVGPSGAVGAAFGDTLLLGRPLLPCRLVVFSSCHRLGLAPRLSRASFLRYAISSPKNNTLF